MATEVLLVRQLDRLAADNPISLETIQGLKHGEVVKATISRVRNVGHHRKFFALLNLVFQNQSRYATMDQLLDGVKIAMGYYEVVAIPQGDVLKTKSISFAKMDQTAFESFYNKVTEWLITDVLPGVKARDLHERVMEIIGDR
jgi:hypothetical protein